MEELNVKVGDKVLYKGRWEKRITTVTKVTPTGRIKTALTRDTQFDKYGIQMGGDSWSRASVAIPTEDDIKQIREHSTKEKAISIMRKMHIENITAEQAEKIIEILEGGNNGNT